MTAASIFRVSNGFFGVRVKFNSALIRDLRKVPAWTRRYDASTKTWRFDRSQLARVKEICARHLRPGDVYIDPALQPPPVDSRLELLGQLIAPLGDDALRRVYLLVAKECHPDHLGDTATMQFINSVWAKLRGGGDAA